ncbi:MAG: molybdopterin-dependent oxidoreductase [Gammaproteobacteria bacterium]
MDSRPETGRRGVATTCPYCGVGCGILTTVGDDGQVAVQGDDAHPANRGRLCSKGAALGETLDHEGRLLFPECHGRRVTWDKALDTVTQGLQRIIEEHGPEAVAFYVSGQLLTEDYYVANKLMKGYIGSANIDTNSRLCMSSAVAGQQRAFGADLVPCDYQDLELADLLVLVGSNAAWCHPVVFQRLRATKTVRKDVKVVVIDPRRTPTCEIADLHLAIRPGTDAVLFNGLLNYVRREDALDWDFLEQHTEGFAAAMTAARATGSGILEVAKACGISPEDVGRFFRWFARTPKTLTLFSQGINQSTSGTDKVNSIINCHLATGRIGKPGMGPFSLTGQPNAMGGREVGGLATMLAAHMDFSAQNVARVKNFWKAPRVAIAPGLKAVDLFQAIGEGRIKAVWIMATNPMVSLPDANRMRSALRRCELVVVSDCVRHTDTTALAHVLLPAASWGEKDGTVTNSERCISRSRRFLSPAGEARPDWWIVTQVARRLGYAEAFPYESAAAIFREHAALSGYENGGTRDFDISGLASLSETQYDDLRPVQWPLGDTPEGRRPFADGRFFTPSGKARFVPVHATPPAHALSDDFPLVLNTGRVRDQWHTMTRTGKSPRLGTHTPEPAVEVHPSDAARYRVAHGRLARVFSRWGEVTVRVCLTSDQLPGSVFVPIHWNAEFASQSRIGAVVNPATDPISGEPEFKHTPVRIAPYTPTWAGFILSRERLSSCAADYWVRARGEQFWRYELGGEAPIDDWVTQVRNQFGHDGEWLDLEDKAAGRYRAVKIRDGRLEACVFISSSLALPSRRWLASLFAEEALDEGDRMSLLAAKPAQGRVDAGRTICACFDVGENTIRTAIREQRFPTVAAMGHALRAGTHCGSCLPELKTLLETSMDERVSRIG